MLDFVKKLFEDNVISEELKSEIESAWQGRIEENCDQVTAQLREEFAQKYEHDKSALVEAVESMLADRLSAELGELAEDRQGLIEARARYTEKMTQDAKTMESFVMNNLRKEINELHEDRQKVAANVAQLESFIVDALAKEIAEFHSDKKDLAETKVKLVRESKAKFEQVKKDFIARSATVISETVSKGLKAEMSQLREDIESARRNDFGRRIFESFASEFAASHLNEKSETAKLLKVVEQQTQELEEAAKIVADAQKLVESRESELRIAKDQMTRKEVMSELLGPLGGDKRTVMKELLESVQTEKLRTAYDKYLPSVMNGGSTPVRKALTEGKEITGDKQQAQTHSGEEKTAEIFDIRRLAGLKV
jgi:methionine synthase I (cobalamin-dependent)